MGKIYSWLYYQVYSKTQRALHYFDLHYAPEIGPLAPTYETQKWCKWCGLRMNIPAKNRFLCVDIDEQQSGKRP